MVGVRVVTDLAECQALWADMIPPERFCDLWEVRECFHRHFQRPPCFIVAEDGGRPCGLLPLSWIDEAGCHGCFPGETWEGKTWLEQNRVVARDAGVLEALLDACPGPYHLRYLLPVESMPSCDAAVDEVGYLFVPRDYGYDIESYFAAFSRKFAKKLRRDLAAFDGRGVSYRLDDLGDYEHLVRLNVERFGERSYFADDRFRESFRDLMHLMAQRGWLRMTAVLIGGEPAAVDMGCLRDGVYTLVAGGTHGEYRGVAKVINVHHMRRACAERMREVDFLCGDFSWKPLFRLTPRPLYLLSNVGVPEPAEAGAVGAHSGE